ncbi:MAG: hypothetical protein UX62_C0003G0010 [Microgenomates group bacterium GW2011_GWA2_46_7]|nr:MAG: hypothetical protein UX62_C0003G0010 [Microgenomates group bacterium GW2011_GWA2_46_7]
MTNLKNIISTTEARRRIFELIDAVQKKGQHYILTENGKAKAILASINDYEDMRETIEALVEDPDLPELAAKADRDVASGDMSDYTSFDDYLKEEGLIVAERGGKYVIQHRDQSRGKKAIKKVTVKSKK